MVAPKKKILVIDDTATVLAWVRKVLTDEGYEVATRDRAVGAGAAILRESPDLVLLDVNMPILDGGELVALLRKRPATRAVPVVLYSSLSSVELQKLVERTGVDGFISKSNDQRDLARSVKDFLARYQEPDLIVPVVDPDAQVAVIATDLPQVTAAIRLMMSEFPDLKLCTADNDAEAAIIVRQHRSVAFVTIALSNPGPLEDLDVLRAVSERRGATVIMLAQGNSMEMTLRANRAGVTHVLARPVSAAALRSAVREALGCPELLPAGVDSRRAPRLRAKLQARFEDHESFDAHTWDISAHGAFLSTVNLREPGQRGRLVLELPGTAEPLILACAVVHVRARSVGPYPQGFAVAFESLTAKDQAALAELFIVQ